MLFSFSKAKLQNENIKKLYDFIRKNKFKESEYWKADGGIDIHNFLLTFSDFEFNELNKDLSNWKTNEKMILIECAINGLNRGFITEYDTRIIFTKLYTFLPNELQKEIYEKWNDNYLIYSKSKTENSNILSIYYYILKNKNVDGDFWYMGGGNNYIQEELNELTNKDWKDLKEDILNWSEFDQYIIIQSIPHGFYDSFFPSLTKKTIENAANFLLELFQITENYETKHDIACDSYFINTSNIKEVKKLEYLRNWMIENGFNYENNSDNHLYNPLKNIEVAIKKAYS